MNLLELESAIKRLPGVLGCVILSSPHGAPSEIQAFIKVGGDRSSVQEAIIAEAGNRGMGDSLQQVLVFELETEAFMGGPDALRQAELFAELGALGDDPALSGALEKYLGDETSSEDRPVLRRVVALSTTWRSEAEVALGGNRGQEVVGQAVGEQSAHGLQVLAQATLEAVHQILGEEVFELTGTWFTEVNGKEVVLVFVESSEGELVGAALARGGPLTEAAVRATLDAVNRRLARAG